MLSGFVLGDKKRKKKNIQVPNSKFRWSSQLFSQDLVSFSAAISAAEKSGGLWQVRGKNS